MLAKEFENLTKPMNTLRKTQIIKTTKERILIWMIYKVRMSFSLSKLSSIIKNINKFNDITP